MKRKSVNDYLIRTVLDDAFREVAIADPLVAFEGYDLSEEEKEILRSRDHRLLGLLGRVVAGSHAGDDHPCGAVEHPLKTEAETEPTDQEKPPMPHLAEVNLLLRLVPQAVPSADGESKVAYAASLHPWPDDKGTTPGADTEAPSRGEPDGEPTEVKWIVRIQPTVLGTEAAGLRVAYSASIHPLTAASDESREPVAHADGPPAGAPWNHQIESAAAKAAARAAQAAAPDQRFMKLLDLVEALQTGDHGG